MELKTNSQKAMAEHIKNTFRRMSSDNMKRPQSQSFITTIGNGQLCITRRVVEYAGYVPTETIEIVYGEKFEDGFNAHNTETFPGDQLEQAVTAFVLRMDSENPAVSTGLAPVFDSFMVKKES